MLSKTIALLSSKRLALFLFFALAICLIPGTLRPGNISLFKYIRFTLLSLFLLNLSICSVTRFKSLRNHTLIIHVGCILTIIGSMAGNFGYIATINLHVGDSSNRAYRWDIKSDALLGFDLAVKKINREYYPVMLKIGVLDKGKQAALFQLKTGESFTYKGFRVQAESLDIEKRSVQLGIYKGDELISHYQATGPEVKGETNFLPLTFKLVAFKNPTIKKIWLDLELSQGGKTTEGISGVNQPLKWNGLRIFHTATGHDPFGNPYAGIQIVKDPGIPLVYLGFISIMLGCSLLLWHKSKK